MKKLKTVSAIVLMLCASAVAFAQQKISGTVKDAAGEPVIGAGIVIQGTSTGVVSDLDGAYTLSAPAGSVLVASCVGYKDSSVKIAAGQTVCNFVLEEDSEYLDDVVVIGYQTVKRRDLTGSVSSVVGKDISKVPVSNIAQALQGKLAGVNITTQDGRPDATVAIRVRGGSSISQSNDPLVLIDGVVGTISDIPADQVESIDVLKDASSTAIYGARGANGVILITTKGAKEGNFSVSYNGFAKVNTPVKYLETLNPYEYVSYVWGNATANGTAYVDSFEKLFGIGQYGDINRYKNVPAYDVQKELYKTSFSHNHDLSISGGNDKTRILFSFGYMDEQGMKVNSFNNRATASLKLNQKIGERLDFALDMRYVDTKSMGNESVTSGTGSVLSSAYRFRPIATSDILGDLGALTEGNVEHYGKQLLWDKYNPYNRTADYEPLSNRQYMRGTASLNWKIFKDLTYHTDLTLGRSYQQNKTWSGPVYNNYLDDATGEVLWAGAATLYKSNSWSSRWTNTLNYDHTFANIHHINILLGHEVTNSAGDSMTMTADHFPSNYTKENAFAMINQYDQDASTNKNPFYSGTSTPGRILSFFGRLNYSLMDKYLLTLTMRADGSSKFAPSHRWGFFPAGAIAWRLSEEPFMKNVGWIDNLKLRASYGTVGNDGIDASLWSQTWTAENDSRWLYSLNNVAMGSYDLASTQMANEDLKWETTVTRNIGIDFGFFDGRLNGTIDLYKNTTLDLLMRSTLPGITGFSSTMANIGQTSNKGIEISMNGVIVENRDFSLTAGFNINFNKNNIDKLNEGVTGIYGSQWVQQNYPSNDFIIEEGSPVGLVRGLQYDGFYTTDDFDYDSSTGMYTLKPGIPDVSTGITGPFHGAVTPSGQNAYPGMAKYKDIAGGENGKPDGIVDDKDYAVIGNMNPIHTGGFNINAVYKGFDLGLFFNWSAGNQVYNINKLAAIYGYKETGVYQNKLAITRNAYKIYDVQNGQLVRLQTPEQLKAANANATMPLAYNEMGVVSDLGIEDGSYLRLNTMTLGYTLPAKLTEKVSIDNLRVYLSAYNLFTLSKYSGLDPEVNTQANMNNASYPTPGVDWGSYPRARSFVFGVNVTF